jgi:hypothetical protein
MPEAPWIAAKRLRRAYRLGGFVSEETKQKKLLEQFKKLEECLFISARLAISLRLELLESGFKCTEDAGSAKVIELREILKKLS